MTSKEKCCAKSTVMQRASFKTLSWSWTEFLYFLLVFSFAVKSNAAAAAITKEQRLADVRNPQTQKLAAGVF